MQSINLKLYFLSVRSWYARRQKMGKDWCWHVLFCLHLSAHWSMYPRIRKFLVVELNRKWRKSFGIQLDQRVTTQNLAPIDSEDTKSVLSGKVLLQISNYISLAKKCSSHISWQDKNKCLLLFWILCLNSSLHDLKCSFANHSIYYIHLFLHKIFFVSCHVVFLHNFECYQYFSFYKHVTAPSRWCPNSRYHVYMCRNFAVEVSHTFRVCALAGLQCLRSQ